MDRLTYPSLPPKVLRRFVAIRLIKIKTKIKERPVPPLFHFSEVKVCAARSLNL